MELLDIFILIFGCIFSYLLGGLSVARLITKKDTGGNISNQGSGNPGTMNMLRTHGFFMGIFTLLCDALKGVIPALFARLYFAQYYDMVVAYNVLYLFGLCAVIGHIFPIYHNFKGGKGIATTLGVFMVADPITSLILFGIFFIVLYFIKISSVVSLLFIIVNSIIQLFKPQGDGCWLGIVLMLLMVLLDIIAHKQNLIRLLDNRENPADMQEGLRKDIEKIKNKQEKKIEKSERKTENIRQKYEKKILKKNEKVTKKIEKLNEQKMLNSVKEDNKFDENSKNEERVDNKPNEKVEEKKVKEKTSSKIEKQDA